VALECLDRVGGTCRIVTAARREQRGNTQLVAANEEDKELAHQSAFDPRRPFTDYANIVGKLLKGRPIGLWLRPNKKVDTTEAGQQPDPHDFSQPTLNTVPINDLASVFGHYDSDSWIQQQGSRCSSFESLGLHSLPCSSYRFQIGFACKP
jgi:hypothetical protein